MVWGEENPVKPGFPTTEFLAAFGVLLLGAYLVSDPIGRSASKSYESAAQTFIETRGNDLSLVSRDNVDVKDLALHSTDFEPDPENPIKVDFAAYQNEVLPALNTQDLNVSMSFRLTDQQEQGTVEAEGNELASQTARSESFVLNDMNGTMKQLLNNEDNTMLDAPFDCSRSDELIGFCGGQELEFLLGKNE